MRPIPIDFARPSLRQGLHTMRPLSWLVLAAIAGFWVVVAVGAARMVQKENAATLQSAALVERAQLQLAQRDAQQAAAPAVPISEAQAAAINAAVAQLNVPWRDLFDALEAATPQSIALLAIEPDARKKRLRGSAEAKTNDDMVAYIEQLKRQPILTRVMLTRHERNEQDPNKPYRFEFECQWTEGGR